MAERANPRNRVRVYAISSAALIAFLLPGCTHIALRDNTVQTAATLTDLHFQQVLDNVARFCDDPSSLPSFAVASSGNVSICDTAGAGVTPTYSPTLSSAQQGGGALPILSLASPLSTQRALTESWTLSPVTDADSLRRLRCAYQLLVLGDNTPSAAWCRKQIEPFYSGEGGETSGTFPPRGWYTHGSKADIPNHAKYVGQHNGTYVWVTAEGTNALAVFALAALDIASGKTKAAQRTVVRKYHGDAKPESIVETLITTTEDGPEPADPTPH